MRPETRSDLLSHHPELAPCSREIDSAVQMLADCFSRGDRVYLAGNGGSAADAEHWAGELLKGFRHSRHPSPSELAALPPDLGPRLQGGLPAIPLTGFLSLRTASLNDQGPEMDFAQLVWALGRPGDVFVAISTSGRAKNLLNAARAAKARGIAVLLLTGDSVSPLRLEADLAIAVPETLTHRIQELHLAIYHAICISLEERFFPRIQDNTP